MCRLSPFPFADASRDYQQLRLRYPQLHVAGEFAWVRALWPDSPALCAPSFAPLVNPAAFFVGTKQGAALLRRMDPADAPPAPPAGGPPPRFFVRVMLAQGLDAQWWEAQDPKHLSKARPRPPAGAPPQLQRPFGRTSPFRSHLSLSLAPLPVGRTAP